jgi:hypothetical protein
MTRPIIEMADGRSQVAGDVTRDEMPPVGGDPLIVISQPAGATRMVYHFAATAVALLHFAFIVFVVTGGVVALRWRSVAWLHLPAAVWGATIEVMHWNCPLTAVENALLQRAGRAGYDEGFIAHYLFALVYPARLTRGMEIAIAIFVVIVNVLVYRRVFR